jgi:hypothetical protein
MANKGIQKGRRRAVTVHVDEAGSDVVPESAGLHGRDWGQLGVGLVAALAFVSLCLAAIWALVVIVTAL